MSTWLLIVQFLAAKAALLARFHDHGGAQDSRLHRAAATTTAAPKGTTVPPAFLAHLALREANLQEQIDRAKQTLGEAEWRLGNITASMNNVTAKLTAINVTLAGDSSLMTGTKSIIQNLNTLYSRQILEAKNNQVVAQIAAVNATAQNISVMFGAAKGKKPDTKDITAKFEALNTTVLLNGSSVEAVLDNFSKMEATLAFNVSEYVHHVVERHTEEVFRNISAKFSDVLAKNTKSLDAGRPCDLVPNMTLCKNQTNATTAKKATTFLQVVKQKLSSLALLRRTVARRSERKTAES